MKQHHLRTAFFLTLLGGVLVVIYFIMKPYLITLAIAATAAVILHPAYDRLFILFRKKATPAVLSMVVLTYVLLLIPLVLLAIQIASDATHLYTKVRNGGSVLPVHAVQAVDVFIGNYIPDFSLNISQYVGQSLNWIAGSVQSFFAGTLQAVLLLFLGTIAYYYMLKDGKRFVASVCELSPLTATEDKELLQRLHRAINSVIRGSLIIAMLQGIVTGLGLALFGIPSAVLLGSIAGIGALIPTIGTSIILVPSIGYLLLTGEYPSAIGLAVWGAVAVGMIDNFLHPLLVGRGMKMHPLFIFLAVIGGIAYFGISGFIIGPLIASLLFGLLDIFKKETKRS